jgi:hypothetical protein
LDNSFASRIAPFSGKDAKFQRSSPAHSAPHKIQFFNAARLTFGICLPIFKVEKEDEIL